MSGLSQQLDKFKFFRPGPDGSQQDVTDQVMQHLPAELQVTPTLMCKHCCCCGTVISTTSFVSDSVVPSLCAVGRC